RPLGGALTTRLGLSRTKRRARALAAVGLTSARQIARFTHDIVESSLRNCKAEGHGTRCHENARCPRPQILDSPKVVGARNGHGDTHESCGPSCSWQAEKKARADNTQERERATQKDVRPACPLRQQGPNALYRGGAKRAPCSAQTLDERFGG